MRDHAAVATLARAHSRPAEVFEVVNCPNGWVIQLTERAAKAAHLKFWRVSICQYARMRTSSYSYGGRRGGDYDAVPVFLRSFMGEAVAWTREVIVLPYRPRSHSPEKKQMCETIAQIANERLCATGCFWPGVNTHGLQTVFADLIDDALRQALAAREKQEGTER